MSDPIIVVTIPTAPSFVVTPNPVPPGTVVGTIGGTGGAVINLVWREVPGGSLDGLNTVFTLAHAPIPDKEQVILNGLELEDGVDNDYILSGATITFNTPPQPGDKILVTYQY